MPTPRYFLWALPRGKTNRLDEQPLTSFALSAQQADAVQAAAQQDGWHSFRRVEDTNAPPNFSGALS